MTDFMKITGYGSINAATTVKKRGDTSQAGGFSDLLSASDAGESSSISTPSEVTAASLSNLFVLQEISEDDVQRRKLLQRGKSLVDVLERLRQQLLIGTMPPHMLQDLHRQLAMHKQATLDPELNAIIEDIELRAAVELAKLEMSLQTLRADKDENLPAS